jgi:alkylhydroperoxidase family enzyme
MSRPRARRCLHAELANGKENIMALRVPKAELTSELSGRLIEQIGAVPEPVEVMWHNPKVAQAALEIGARAGEWDALDEGLKSFAHMAVAAQVGCSWCSTSATSRRRTRTWTWPRRAR